MRNSLTELRPPSSLLNSAEARLFAYHLTYYLCFYVLLVSYSYHSTTHERPL